MKFKQSELKEFLDEKVDLYNRPSFIVDDPISIPHLYSQKEDIEISGFLEATIAWGNRKMILRNANRIIVLILASGNQFPSQYFRVRLMFIQVMLPENSDY